MRTTATPAHQIRRTGALSIATVLAVASLAACGGDGEDVGTVTAPVAPAPSPDTAAGGATSGSSGAVDDQDAAVEVPEGVTAERAQEIALELYPGTVDELELDNDDGRTVWEIDIDGDDGWEYEVEIDAETGDVIKQERDDRVDD